MSHDRKRGRITLTQRWHYAFDNVMARGLSGQITLLVVLSGIALVVIVVATVVAGAVFGRGGNDAGFMELLTNTGLLILVPDPVNLGEEGTLLFVSEVIAIMAGLFVGATLIGILTAAIEDKMEDLRRGRSFVAETNHTVILGWSPKIFRIVSELVIANENHPGLAIAILAPKDSVEMAEELAERVGDYRGSKVVCRTGNPAVGTDLDRVNLDDARSLIVLSPQEKADPDAQVIKVLLTIAHRTRDSVDPAPVVVEFQDRDSQRVCRAITGGSRLDVLSLVPGELLPRVLVQTCRQRGLAEVYSELFQFEGDELYFTRVGDLPDLAGKPFREVVFAFEDSSIIGLLRGGGVHLNPPADTVCEADDELIAITEDDDTTVPSGRGEVPIDEDALAAYDPAQRAQPERSLVIGWAPHTMSVLRALDDYAPAGSQLTLACGNPDAYRVVEAHGAELVNHEFDFHVGDVGDRAFLETIEVQSYDNVLVLPDVRDAPAEDIDAVTIKCLVHLRDLARKREADLSITAQMLTKESSDVAETTELGDFVVGDEITGRIIAQLAEERRLDDVFRDLLDPEGSEIYIKPMAHYVAIGAEVSFYTVLEAALRKQEIAIGHVRDGTILVNPDKAERVRFAEGDQVIVIAEDVYCHRGSRDDG